MALLSPLELEHPSPFDLLDYWYPSEHNGEKVPNDLGASLEMSPNILSLDNGCAAATSSKSEDMNAAQAGATSPTSQDTERKQERALELEDVLNWDPPPSANKRRDLTTTIRCHATPKWPGLPQSTLPLPSDLTLIREQANNSAKWVKHTLDFCYEYRQFLQSKSATRRVDLETWKYMKAHGLLVNQEKRNGEVPGVPVGFRFFSRVELAMVGMHFAFQSLIDTRFDEDFKQVATSVIIAGAKDDCIYNNGEVVEYTGQGGAHHKADKGVPDQKMCGANMAMFLSFKRSYPIRLVRGKPDERSPSNTTFTYYGLYRITGMQQKRGSKGNNIYSFQMSRLPNQTPIKFSRRQIHYPPC